MSAIDIALQRIARETEISFRLCHEMAVQRLVDSNWLYRDTVGRALGIGVKEAWELSDVEILRLAEELIAKERKLIARNLHNQLRYLACCELAAATKRKMERVMSDVISCKRCNGSGEIGKRINGDREAPGPVPDDARGWIGLTCPDCNGIGMIEIEDDEERDA